MDTALLGGGCTRRGGKAEEGDSVALEQGIGGTDRRDARVPNGRGVVDEAIAAFRVVADEVQHL